MNRPNGMWALSQTSEIQLLINWIIARKLPPYFKMTRDLGGLDDQGSQDSQCGPTIHTISFSTDDAGSSFITVTDHNSQESLVEPISAAELNVMFSHSNMFMAEFLTSTSGSESNSHAGSLLWGNRFRRSCSLHANSLWFRHGGLTGSVKLLSSSLLRKVVMCNWVGAAQINLQYYKKFCCGLGVWS